MEVNPKEISIHVGDLGLNDEAKLLEGVVSRDYEDDIDQKPLRIQVLDRLVKPAVNTNDVQTIRYEVTDT